jgi:hypothetical protein
MTAIGRHVNSSTTLKNPVKLKFHYYYGLISVSRDLPVAHLYSQLDLMNDDIHECYADKKGFKILIKLFTLVMLSEILNDVQNVFTVI